MPSAKTRGPASQRESAAFRRVRADHQDELAQDYVELIAELIDQRGEARGTDIAKRLGVASPTVAKTIRRLQDRGLIVQKPYRSIFLTEEGHRLAADGHHRHRVVEDFLLALGVSAETARIDAEGIEHHVSEETLRAMKHLISVSARSKR